MPTFTAEQRMLVDSLSDLAHEEFAERAFEWQGAPPWENIDLLADRGYLGINLPAEYGGGGLSEFEAMLSIEVVGRVCPDTGAILYYQQMVGPRTIDMFGSEAAKEEFLPAVAAGDRFVAVAISEPEAGSDVRAMNTAIEEINGELVLNGEKVWVSFFDESDAAVTWVKFPEGLGAVILDLTDPGIEVAQHFTNMAGHRQTQFYIEDVVIPEEYVLTRGREAFIQNLKALSWERLGSSAFANAMAACAVDKALDYAADREQFGQPIAEFQGIEWKFADMVTNLEASRALTHRAAERGVESDRVPSRLDSSLAKLYSAEMVETVVSEALQIHGANGYQQGHPLEYLYRLARARRIAAGTDEIQKNAIASVIKQDGVPSL